MSSWCQFLLRGRKSPALSFVRYTRTAAIPQDIKTLKDMPHTNALDSLRVMQASRQKKFHLILEAIARKHGPMVRFRMGAHPAVLCTSVSAIETMFRRDEKYPTRMQFAPVEMITDKIEQATGVVYQRGVGLLNGPEWKRQRSVIQKAFLRPRQMSVYANVLDDIAADAVQTLGDMRSKSFGTFSGFALNEELAKWSFEGALAILSDKRIDFYSDLPKDFHIPLLRAMDKNFYIMEQLLFIPPKLAQLLNLKLWKDYIANNIEVFTTVKKLFDTFNADLLGHSDKQNLMQQLYEGGFSAGEVVSSALDLLLASLDTTARTAAFAIYVLGREPHLQEELRQAFRDNPDSSNISFVSAFIKEVLRVFPVATSNLKRFDADIVLDGYEIPRNLDIVIGTWSMSRDPELFPDPFRVDPSRWLPRQSSTEFDRQSQPLAEPFSFIPFGFGRRSCIGKRLAEMELTLLLKNLLQRYHVKLTDDTPVELELRFLLRNVHPLPVSLVDL